MLTFPSRLALGASTLLLGSACLAQAATEFTDSVPVELARFLAGGGRIFQGLPEGFEGLRPPPGLEVIGSLDQGTTQRALLRSEREPAAAAQGLARAFGDQGWILQAGGGDEGVLQLCHEREGQMQIWGQAGEESRVYLVRHTLPCGQSPEQLAAVAQAGPAITPELQRLLPTLSAPENLAEDFELTPFRRVPGSPDELEAQADIRIDRSVGEVYGWFMQQLREQGWEPDAEWYGEVTAGGNWLRRRDNGQQLVGTLQILEVGENQFEMSVQLQQRG